MKLRHGDRVTLTTVPAGVEVKPLKTTETETHVSFHFELSGPSIQDPTITIGYVDDADTYVGTSSQWGEPIALQIVVTEPPR